VGSNLIENAKNEIVWLLPPAMVVFAAQFDIANKSKTLVENGGQIRSIFHISSQYVELAQSLLDIGKTYATSISTKECSSLLEIRSRV
jgi:beta-lactamase superfamily II metal-dependent hydrolase